MCKKDAKRRKKRHEKQKEKEQEKEMSILKSESAKSAAQVEKLQGIADGAY